jgi:hypothetical protein
MDIGRGQYGRSAERCGRSSSTTTRQRVDDLPGEHNRQIAGLAAREIHQMFPTSRGCRQAEAPIGPVTDGDARGFPVRGPGRQGKTESSRISVSGASA